MDAQEKWLKAIELLDSNPTESELKEIVELVQDAVADNHGGANFTLSSLYYSGYGVEQDKNKSYELLCKSLELGYERAKLMLARFYVEGEVVEKDLAKAEQYLREMSEKDDKDACAYLANYIFNNVFPNSSHEEGLSLLEKAAKLGHPNSMGQLGELLGNYCRDEESNFWFEKAKEMGLQGVDEARLNYTSETYPQRLVNLIHYYESTKEYSKALELLERDVSSDNHIVLLLVGKYYVSGIGEEHYGQDIPRSISIFENLSAVGNHFADYELGMIYMGGYPEYNIEQNIVKATNYFIKSAEEGDAEAQFVIGDLLYNKGILGDRDKEKAILWIESAARQEHKGALCLIACSYLQDPDINTLTVNNLQYEQDIDKGMQLLRRAADLGDSKALYILAICYQKGKYVVQDSSKAFELLQKCVQIDKKPEHVNLLGDYYRDGVGTEQDYEDAAKCYQWAADNGYAAAMASLSNLYREGKGVEKNEETAIQLMYKANEYYNWNVFGVRPLEVAREQANQGDVEAMFQLGNRYDEGDGVEQNAEVASDWWLRAAMKGHIKAAHNLGYYYFFTKHDIENGLKWLNKAADSNVPLSLCILGDIFINGWGVDADKEKGLVYINKAANMDDPDSQIKLATMYHDGVNIEKDTEKAKYWLEKYLSHDSADAHYRMGLCLYHGDMYAVDYPKALEHFAIAVKGRCHDASPYYIDMLWRGNKVPQNHDTVIETYKELDEDDDEVASYILYTLYSDEGYSNMNKETAIAYLKKSAEDGYNVALREIGLQHMENGLFETDYSKAYNYLRQAAERNDTTAMVNLAFGYQNGKEIEQDISKALELYLKAADLGNIYGAREAALIYLKGEEGIIDVDIDKAIELLKQPAETDIESCFYLAYTLNAKCDMEDCYSWQLAEAAFHYMLKAANAGHPEAMFLVARSFLEGRGVLWDMEQSRIWFEKTKSINYRTEDVNDNLDKYFSDYEPAHNYPRFVYWHSIIEHNPSMIKEKELYIDEEGYMIQSAVARGAAQCGDVNAAWQLGFSLLDSDPEKAWKYMEYVINLGYTDFANIVGKAYYTGDNVKKDALRAYMYFSHGARLGNLRCKLSLGLMCTAEGVTKESEEKGKQLLISVCEESDEGSEVYNYAKAQLDRIEQRENSSISKLSKGFRSLFGKK